MIVGPRYNDVDPAVEAAYERAAEAEFECGHPEGCCDHAGSDEHGCWDCRNTGHTHETDPQPVCTCHVVPDPWTYYGAVEPGGSLEWDPDCPVHRPAPVTHQTFTEGDPF